MPTQPSKTFQLLSERLKQLRQRHDLTQESLAQMSGVAYKYYQEIEGCRLENLEILTIEKLASVFGLEAFHLFSNKLPATKLKSTLSADAPHNRRKRMRVTSGISKDAKSKE